MSSNRWRIACRAASDTLVYKASLIGDFVQRIVVEFLLVRVKILVIAGCASIYIRISSRRAANTFKEVVSF